MRNLRKNILGLCLVGMGLGAGASAQAATGVGPYYAMPAWDQTLPPATRFIELSNMNSEAVLDRETGLVWEKAPSQDTYLWERARTYCAGKAIGGRMGWRLPAFDELSSLYLVGGTNLFFGGLPGAPFVNIPRNEYWSSTGFIDNSGSQGGRAYSVLFTRDDGGGGTRITNISVAHPAWCVRGGSAGNAG